MRYVVLGESLSAFASAACDNPGVCPASVSTTCMAARTDGIVLFIFEQIMFLI